MGRRLNKWIQRLLVPACVLIALTLVRVGVTVRWTVAILLLLFGLAGVAMVVADPGPKAKGFVERMKNGMR